MRLTEFWRRMEFHLGEAYARSWAHDQVLSLLDGRTVDQALAAGIDTRTVWLAVHESLGLPATYR
jgi:hypothetical protein